MFVIGAGRVGGALEAAAQAHELPCRLVTRDDGWDALAGPPGDPILLAVRNDDMEEVVGRLPVHRRDDLVFLQNGMIRPWLRDRGLGACTRGLLYFAVPSRGAPIQPGGYNPFSGTHALTVVQWLVGIGLQARVVDWASFTALELHKLLWLSAFGVLCERYEMTVGEVSVQRREELRALVQELARLGRIGLGVEMPLDYLVDRLCEYSMAIPDFRVSVKEWTWRNGWFDQLATRHGVATPIHRELLAAIGKP